MLALKNQLRFYIHRQFLYNLRMVVLFFLFSLTSIVLAQTSYIPATYLLKKGGNQFGINTDYFSTSKTINYDGEKNSLADGQSYTQLQSEFSGYYGANDDLQFGIGARYRRNQAEYVDLNGADATAASSGIQSTFISVGYAFPRVDRLQYTLEGQFRYNPYTNEENTLTNPGKLVLGDDGNEYYAGLGVTYASPSSNYLTLRSGYRRPGQDISSEIYWIVEGALAWRYAALVAGVDGNTSLNNDPYEADGEARPIRNTGGSFLYNSQNREWITPYAGLNIAFNKQWRVEFKASQVVAGTSTDMGTTFGVNLIRRADRPRTKYVDRAFKSYDIEASVTKVSPKKEYVVVDKGLTSDVQKGMRFDFFENDYVGGNILVASGTVVQVKAETSIVKITQRHNSKTELKSGLLGRASVK